MQKGTRTRWDAKQPELHGQLRSRLESSLPLTYICVTKGGKLLLLLALTASLLGLHRDHCAGDLSVSQVYLQAALTEYSANNSQITNINNSQSSAQPCPLNIANSFSAHNLIIGDW